MQQSLKAQDNLDEYDQIFLHVFAPVIVNYVRWVLETAKSKNIDRLYFLARDGWIMYHIASYIQRNRTDLQIELRYIHVSRYVLRNAEYSFVGRDVLDSVFVGGIDITFEKLMKRVDFTDEEIINVAKEIDFTERIKECLSYAQIQELKLKVDECSELFFKYVEGHSKEFFDTTIGYLRENGLFEDVSYAIVDSGWLGSTQKSLNRLISHISGKSPRLEGFYFGLYDIPDSMAASDYHAYYIKPGKNISRKSRFSICLFETTFSSPEGMTIGYRDKIQGGFEAVQSDKGNPNSAFMKRNYELVKQFVYNLDKVWFLEKADEKKSTQIAEKLLSKIMSNPTALEASTFGGLQFCDDVLELQMQNVAAKWDMGELHNQQFFRRIRIKFFKSNKKLHESGWPEASIVNLLGEGYKASNALRGERLYKRLMYVRKAIKK